MKNNKKIVTFIVSILSIIGFLAVMVRTSKYGPGITHDSVAYLYSAASFKAGKGFLYFGYPSPFIQWPVLFSFLLGILSMSGIKALVISRVINSITFAAIIFITGSILQGWVKNSMFAVLGAFFVLCAFPLFNAAGYLWTEPLFILLSALFIMTLAKGKYSEHNNQYLYLAIAYAAVASILRYAGVIFIVTGCAYLLTYKGDIKSRFIRAFKFGFFSSLPFVLLVIRNYLVSGTLLGMRTPSGKPFLYNANLAYETVRHWLIPTNRVYPFLSTDMAGLLKMICRGSTLIFIILIGAYLIGRIVSRQKLEVSGNKNGVGMFHVSILFFVFYSFYMVESATKVAFDTIGDRYMLPVFIPVLFMLIFLLDQSASMIEQKLPHLRRVSTAVIACIFILWMGCSVAAEYQLVKDSRTIGAGGYNIKRWVESPAIAYIKTELKGNLIYSNYADAVYLLTGMEANYTPKKQGIEMYGLKSFQKRLGSADKAYLVWFKEGQFEYIYNPEQLKGIINIKHLADTLDAQIFEISRP